MAAVLIPLAAFAVQAIFIRQLKRSNAYIATGAIVLSCFLSLVGFVEYFASRPRGARQTVARTPGRRRATARARPPKAGHHGLPLTWKAELEWVSLGGVGAGPGPAALVVRLGVAIDNLAAIMFLMVTFIATLIHIYSIGYMHDDPRYPAVLRLPVAVLLLDARPGRLVQRLHDLHLLGAGRRLLVPADRLLVRGEGELRRGQQGVHRQPGRRRGDARRAWACSGPTWARSTSRRSTEGFATTHGRA